MAEPIEMSDLQINAHTPHPLFPERNPSESPLNYLPSFPRLFSSGEVKIEVVQVMSPGRGQIASNKNSDLSTYGWLILATVMHLSIESLETLYSQLKVR